MMVEILAWLTVVGLPILSLVVIWFLWKKIFPKPIDPPAPLHDLRYAYTEPPPPGYVEPATTITTTNDKMFTWRSIDEQSFMTDENDEVLEWLPRPLSAWKDPDEVVIKAKPKQRPIFRIYASIDGEIWDELTPATDIATAFNVASYLKKKYPTKRMRIVDLNGVYYLKE